MRTYNAACEASGTLMFEADTIPALKLRGAFRDFCEAQSLEFDEDELSDLPCYGIQMYVDMDGRKRVTGFREMLPMELPPPLPVLGESSNSGPFIFSGICFPSHHSSNL